MNDTPKTQPATERAAEQPQERRPGLSDRDEAAPGTPGTGENIDPKTGEKFVEGIGGA